MKKKQSNLTIFAILTTLTILTWVAFEVYQRFYRKDISIVPQKILSPVNPSLDTSVLDDLEQKQEISQDDAGRFNFAKSSSIQPDRSQIEKQSSVSSAKKEAPQASGSSNLNP